MSVHLNTIREKIIAYVPEKFEPLSIELDKFTPCLVHRQSGEIYSTEMHIMSVEDFEGEWKFDWPDYITNRSYETYKLVLKGDTVIQGLICLEIRENWIEVVLAESALWNIGSEKKEFIGVGGHLFAFACKKSLELGYEGFVAFNAKTRIIIHYQQILNADILNPITGRMAIDEDPARKLISTYYE